MVLLVERGRDIQEFACRSLRCGLLFSAAISHVSNVMCMHTISTIIIPNLPIMHELQSLATHLRLPSSFQLHKRGIVRCNSLFQTPLDDTSTELQGIQCCAAELDALHTAVNAALQTPL